MIDNYNLILLSGGFHQCDSSWDKTTGGTDLCYKVYFPVSGRATVETDTEEHSIETGRVYFISGFRLARQHCDHSMSVYWIHFVPESLYLRYLLDQLPPVQSWPHTTAGWPSDSFQEICRIFEDPFNEQNRPRSDSSPATACRIQGLLLTMISQVLRALDTKTIEAFNPRYYQLKPALDYLQNHYRDNPSLEEIADQVHMAPTYFHRQFRQLFGVTPFNFMMAQRLNKARHLLASTSLTVKEVAETVGYDNPLYFSRVFTAGMRVSPSLYRAQHAEQGKKP